MIDHLDYLDYLDRVTVTMAAPRLRTVGSQLSTLVSSRAPVASSSRTLRPLLAVPGPSFQPLFNQNRDLSTTTVRWKKSTKAPSSKASKSKPRAEVENVDYEDPGLDQTLAKVGVKMEKAVEWARVVVFESVERGRGRVSPCESWGTLCDTRRCTPLEASRLMFS